MTRGEEYLTVDEIAAKLKVKKPTAYRICHQIGCLRLGPGPRAPIRVPVEDYERWARENRRGPARSSDG